MTASEDVQQKRGYEAHHARNVVLSIGCVVFLGALFILGLSVGRMSIAPADVAGILSQHFFGTAGSWS